MSDLLHVVASLDAIYFLPSITDSTISSSSTRISASYPDYCEVEHTDNHCNLRVMVPYLTPVVQVGTTTNDFPVVDDHQLAVDIAYLALCQM